METLHPTSLLSNSGWLIHDGNNTIWTKEENKKFESALALFDEKTPNRWFNIAAMIPGKSVCDVINQYRALVADVSDIEAGLVPIPGYLASSFTVELADHRGFDVYRKRARNGDHERKKGVPWTQEEHRRFLLGLEKHGKGDWRNIARNFVISKTPTQVASHAQKYYLRQLSGGKDRRRPSIHDVTIVNPTNASPPKLKEKLPVAENFGEHKPATIQSNTPKIEMQWNHSYGEGFIVLNSAAAGPDDRATRNRYAANIYAGTGFSRSQG